MGRDNTTMGRRTGLITVGNYAHPMLPFIMMEVVFRWWQYSRGKFSGYKWSSARITSKNWFGTLKARLKCLQRSMDININILLQIFCLCLQLYNSFELQKEQIPKQSFVLTLSFEKRVLSAISNLSLKLVLKEKKSTDIG